MATWAEMKREMRARFVPKHYKRDLFDKLQNLKQGRKSMEEYYNDTGFSLGLRHSPMEDTNVETQEKN